MTSANEAAPQAATCEAEKTIAAGRHDDRMVPPTTFGATAPPLLRRLGRQFIRWRGVRNAEGKIEKTPCVSKGWAERPASWLAFDDVAAEPLSDLGGVGLVMFGGVEFDGYKLVVLDLDAAVDPATREPMPWARETLALFDNSYTETSISGTGLHLFLLAKFPPPSKAGTKIPLPAGFAAPGVKKTPEIEPFVFSGFVTVSNRQLAGTGAGTFEALTRVDDLSKLYLHFQRAIPALEETPSTVPPVGIGPEPSIDEIAERLAAGGQKVAALLAKNRAYWIEQKRDDAKADKSCSAMFFKLGQHVMIAAHGHIEAALAFLLDRTDWVACSDPDAPGCKYDYNWIRRDLTSAWNTGRIALAWRRAREGGHFEPIEPASSSAPDEPKPDKPDEAAPTTPAAVARQTDPLAGHWLSPTPEWLTQDPPPQRFLVARPALGGGMLPRGIAALLAGAGGIGKTEALLNLAVAIAIGGAWFDHFPVADAAGKVLLMPAEEDEAEVRRRIHRQTRQLTAAQRAQVCDRLVVMPAAGFSVALVAKANSRDSAAPTPFLEALEAKLHREAGPDGWAALLLGPLSRLAGAPIDADNDTATRVVQALERLCRVPGEPTVLVDCHTNAVSRRDGEDASVRGPTGLVDGVRWWAAMQCRTKNGPVEFTERKSNRGPLNATPVILERDFHGTLRVAVTSTESAAAAQARAEDALRTDAAAREAKVLEIMQTLGGVVTSRETVYSRMQGKTNLKRAAFAACIDRGEVLAEGRGRRQSYRLARTGGDTHPPHTPYALGARGEDRPGPVLPGANTTEGRKGARGEDRAAGGAA